MVLESGGGRSSRFRSVDRPDAGFAVLADVRTRAKRDRMHSFFFAETLKYAYLLLAPPETLDLGAVVFNTEAHPLRVSRSGVGAGPGQR